MRFLAPSLMIYCCPAIAVDSSVFAIKPIACITNKVESIDIDDEGDLYLADLVFKERISLRVQAHID